MSQPSAVNKAKVVELVHRCEALGDNPNPKDVLLWLVDCVIFLLTRYIKGD